MGLSMDASETRRDLFVVDQPAMAEVYQGKFPNWRDTRGQPADCIVYDRLGVSWTVRGASVGLTGNRRGDG
jgi:hypothetical protein